MRLSPSKLVFRWGSKALLKKEIVRCDNALEKVDVDKFGSHTNVFKVEFNSINQPEKAIRMGLLRLNVKIASYKIEKYTYLFMRF